MTEITAGASNGANGRLVPAVNGKASYAEKHNIADHFIGGNRLENAPPSKVKDFVAQSDGHTVITNVRERPFPSPSPFPPCHPHAPLGSLADETPLL